eukprot:CAMPEP_0117460960 /NCGR_PEP_ID=MMETSP0784-20121206/2277_1 /TAXON_ID=39447 /ORGANISM="" /LENGTH=181 /DNA_ID=CAMNT_0005254649 /DNA_START=482 /DNA_END=1027 /DNA_ORIENTATION=+
MQVKQDHGMPLCSIELCVNVIGEFDPACVGFNPPPQAARRPRVHGRPRKIGKLCSHCNQFQSGFQTNTDMGVPPEQCGTGSTRATYTVCGQPAMVQVGATDIRNDLRCCNERRNVKAIHGREKSLEACQHRAHVLPWDCQAATWWKALDAATDLGDMEGQVHELEALTHQLRRSGHMPELL